MLLMLLLRGSESAMMRCETLKVPRVEKTLTVSRGPCIPFELLLARRVEEEKKKKKKWALGSAQTPTSGTKGSCRLCRKEALIGSAGFLDHESLLQTAPPIRGTYCAVVILARVLQAAYFF